MSLLEEPDWIAHERAASISAITDGDLMNLLAERINGHTYDSPTIGEQPVLDIVNWPELFHGVTHEIPVIDGLAFNGRWTALVAPGKAGKSTFTISAATCTTRGIDPFDGNPTNPIDVLYIDAEMGRIDMLERLEELSLQPDDLTRLHYVDVVPKLDTIAGAAMLLADVKRIGTNLVIIDGINGAVQGAENDDTTWRAFYDLTVSPLKRIGVALVTNDNLGKDKTLGPRGSSVKIDKPDAVIQIGRTDNGVKLTTTHRRTAAYPLEVDLVLVGADGSQPIVYRRASASWPAGTRGKAAELDSLGLPLSISNRAARAALKEAGIPVGTSDALAAAIRYRKTHIPLALRVAWDADRNTETERSERSEHSEQSSEHSSEHSNSKHSEHSPEHQPDIASDQVGTLTGTLRNTPPGETEQRGVCNEVTPPCSASSPEEQNEEDDEW